MVEPVGAGEDGDGVAEGHGVHANAAVCCAVIAGVGLGDGAFGEGFYGVFGGWAGRVAGLVLFHELADDAVQRFLAVDCVAVDAAGWTEVVEQLEEGCWEDWCAAGTAAGVVVVVSMERREGADVVEHLLHEFVHVLWLGVEGLWSVGISW